MISFFYIQYVITNFGSINEENKFTYIIMEIVKMAESLSGTCLCGEIKFSGKTEIKRIANCHCLDCQKITGASFATIIFVNAEEISIVGSAAVYKHISDSGSQLEKHFCRNCGSQMFSFNSSRAGLIGLRAGNLNEKELIEPQVNVYLERKTPSTLINSSLPSYNKMPE